MAENAKTHVRIEAQTLPYPYEALAPVMSEETLRFHHDKHYVGYVTKLNELIADTEFEHLSLAEIVLRAEDGAVLNNAAQAWNHEFFFAQFAPKPADLKEGDLARVVERDFGGKEQLIAQMNAAAASLFGSGWVWLVADAERKLSIRKEQNAGNPLRYDLKPLLCLDVWEHAYYIDYRNRRPDAVAAWWKAVDWRVVEERYAAL